VCQSQIAVELCLPELTLQRPTAIKHGNSVTIKRERLSDKCSADARADDQDVRLQISLQLSDPRYGARVSHPDRRAGSKPLLGG
jgi:hypothetical protein